MDGNRYLIGSPYCSGEISWSSDQKGYHGLPTLHILYHTKVHNCIPYVHAIYKTNYYPLHNLKAIDQYKVVL